MMISRLTLTILWFIGTEIVAEPHEPHLHPEAQIKEYNGPLTKEMLSPYKSAEIIEFVNCNVTEVPEKFLSSLPKLRKVIVQNVTATNVHAHVHEGAAKLVDFEFIGNSWTGANLEVWNSLEHLKRLLITEQKVPFAELKANSLSKTKLRYLEISYSGVEKIDDLAFNNLDKLETLILSGNKLKTISRELLKPLKSLEKLDLRENLLESFDSSQLPNLPRLKKMNLSKNPLKNFALDGIEKVAPKLKTVRVSESSISEEQLENLRRNTKIEIHKDISIIIRP